MEDIKKVIFCGLLCFCLLMIGMGFTDRYCEMYLKNQEQEEQIREKDNQVKEPEYESILLDGKEYNLPKGYLHYAGKHDYSITNTDEQKFQICSDAIGNEYYRPWIQNKRVYFTNKSDAIDYYNAHYDDVIED